MVAPGKGLLANDESSGTIKKRFGQGDERATARFNAMNAGGAKLPWPLSFSYARALQAPALKAWKAQPGSVAAAQKALFHRAKLNSAACLGRYKAEM